MRVTDGKLDVSGIASGNMIVAAAIEMDKELRRTPERIRLIQLDEHLVRSIHFIAIKAWT